METKAWRCVLVIISVINLLTSAAEKPHIILIVADDLGWNDVSWHNPHALTPHLESLARGGVILEQAYVQPICTPTRSALLTGRYPFTLGRQNSVLKDNEPTGLTLNATLLPQSLKEVGYSTHAVGKWHLGFCSWDYTPTKRGFDTFYGYYNGAEDYFTHRRGYVADRIEECEDKSKRVYLDLRNNTEPDDSKEGIYSSHLFASYVEDLLSSRSPKDPMFLYLPFQDCHMPLMVPDNYTKPYVHIKDIGRRTYLGMVTAMDEAVGRVISALKSTGHYNNSVIVFTTDNGGPTKHSANNWPLRGYKTTLWEGGTRGAAFVHSPLLPNPGTVSHNLIHVTDWYQTLVKLAGGVAPSNTDGFNQWENIAGRAPSPRTQMIYNLDDTTKLRAGIRVGDLKLLINPGNAGWVPPPEGKSAKHFKASSYKKKSLFSGSKMKNVLDWRQDPRATWSEDSCKEKHNTRSLKESESERDVKELDIDYFNRQDDMQLYNVKDDPEERVDLSQTQSETVQDLLKLLLKEMPRYVKADLKPGDPKAHPKYFNNIWSPGWC